MAVSPPQKMNYEEWLTFPDKEGTRSELIDGEVWVTALPSPRHQRIVGNLYEIFRSHLREHGGGDVFLPVNVRLADDQGFGPDITFVRDWGDDPLTYYGPPPLVIEVVSDARRERIKRVRYARFGVAEYWAVLPDAEQIQVFRLHGNTYGPATIYEAPDAVSPDALPGLVVDVAAVFES
jgi:Uma2 family endonuclease